MYQLSIYMCCFIIIIIEDLYKYLKLIVTDTETFIQSMKNDNTWKKKKLCETFQ
jgi:hypothetical protein